MNVKLLIRALGDQIEAIEERDNRSLSNIERDNYAASVLAELQRALIKYVELERRNSP